MYSDSSAYFLLFYNNIDIFLLIMVRMLGFLMMLPIFTGSTVPNITKLGIASFLSIIIMSTGNFMGIQYENSIFGYLTLIIQEFLVGFIISYVVYIIFSIFYFVGQLVDYQIGFSMVSVYDPMSQIQVPITGNLFYLLMTLLFVVSGGLNSMIYTVAKSYDILPIGKAVIITNTSLIVYILDLIVRYFELGVKIALPIVGTIIVVDISLGLLTKAVPQMNVFVVGMPIKLLIGLIVLYFIIPMFGEVYDIVYDDVIKYTMNILRGMMTE